MSSTPIQPRNNGGAPRNNANRLAHGRYSTRQRFSQWKGISKTRPELSEVEGDCERLLRQLEDAVVAARGTTTLEDASAIDLATGALFVQRLALRRLLMFSALPADAEMALAKDALQAMQVRHKFIVALRLPRLDDEPAWPIPDPLPEDDDEPQPHLDESNGQ